MDLIITSLVSGLVGALLSSLLYFRYEKRKVKFDTAQRLFANKYQADSHEFVGALNEVSIVFHDSSEIIDALDKLWSSYQVPGAPEADNKMLNLFKVICKELNINFKNIENDTHLARTFSPKSTSINCK